MSGGPGPIVVPIEAGDRVRGFGVRFAPFQRGDVWRLRVTNRAYGHQAYAPSGRFSIGGRHHLLETAGDDLIEYRPPGDRAAVRITPTTGGATLRQVAPPSTERAQGAPAWADGTWLSGTWVGLDQSVVESDLGGVRASGLDFVGRIVDGPWHGYTGELFTPDDPFPDFDGMVRRHADAGLEVAVWLAPHIPIGTDQWQRFADRGWFVNDRSGEPLVFAVVGSADLLGSYLDITAEAPRSAWIAGLRRLRDQGVRAVKLDFGEALPSDAVLRNEVPDSHGGSNSRNAFPLAMQRATVEGIGVDGFVIARSGWTGSERVVANWVGDQSSDLSRFSGLMSAIWALRSAVDSGYTTVGFDIGGYFGAPDEATFLACQRTAALFDVGMYHGLTERAPWRRSDGALREHRRLAALPPQRWEGGSTVTVGRTDDRRAIVQRASATTVAAADLREPAAVVLPEGLWRSVDSDREVEGGRTVACEGGEVFVIA